MLRSLTATRPTAPRLAVTLAATAGIAAPSLAAYPDTNSWEITVENDPIGCPGTTTVTVEFRFRKSAFGGGGLNAGTMEIELRDADGDNLFFNTDDTIGRTTYSWNDQAANYVDIEVEFEVECVTDDDGCCTIRGNAGTDDEGDTHEMYIWIKPTPGNQFGNNEWTSPKNQGSLLTYSFPLNCGCEDDTAGSGVRYRPNRTGDDFSTNISFDLPDTDAAPVYFQAEFEYDQTQIALVDEVALIDPEIRDAIGPLEIFPTSGGMLVSAEILDPAAVRQLGEIPLELLMHQVDPGEFGVTRITHEPFNTFVAFDDGTSGFFGHSEGDIPLRPSDSEPPAVDIQLVELDLVSVQPIVVAEPGAVTDNLDDLLPGQNSLRVEIRGPDGELAFWTDTFAEPDGSFLVDPGADPLPEAGTLRVTATDAAGNSTTAQRGFGESPCNPADLAPPFGVLDLSDISEFIALFEDGSGAADLNGDGVNDLGDVAAFLSAFVDGCP